MTGKELVQWILNNNALDLPVEIAYRDKDQIYDGTDLKILLEISSGDEIDELGRLWQYRRLVL